MKGMRVIPLVSYREKLRGLLGRRAPGHPVLLVGCRSVHTFGMRYPLDLAFVDARGDVVASWMEVPPGRVVRAPGARYVLERPASGEPWPRVGQRLGLAVVEEGGCHAAG